MPQHRARKMLRKNLRSINYIITAIPRSDELAWEPSPRGVLIGLLYAAGETGTALAYTLSSSRTRPQRMLMAWSAVAAFM